MIEFLFLDLDDTILDFHKAERIALSKTIREFGIEPTEEVLHRYHLINKWHWEQLELGTMTRDEVLAFLEEYHLSFVEDGSNETDAFLRNRLRHHVMPLLRQENPRLAENVSQMAMSLRQDEEALRCMTGDELPDIAALRQMPDPLRSRALEHFLKKNGVKLPKWYKEAAPKKAAAKHADKLRKNQPKEEPVAEEASAEEAPVETPAE